MPEGKFTMHGGYKTGPGLRDTAYATPGEVVDLSDEEFERLSGLGAVVAPDDDGEQDTPETKEGDEVFDNPDVDPAGDPNTEEKTESETFDTADAEAKAAGPSKPLDEMTRAELKQEAARQGVQAERSDGDASKEPTKQDYIDALSDAEADRDTDER